MKIKTTKLGLFGLGAILLGSAFAPVMANADTMTKDLNIDVVAENTLQMNLSTNKITFTGYNGTQDLTNSDLDITVSSGLNYDINAKVLDEIKGTQDATSKIAIGNLGIKTSAENDYKHFTAVGTPIKVVSNATNGRDKVHNIDLKLKGDASVKADTYKTTLQFEAVQK